MRSTFFSVYLATIAHATAYGVSFLLPLRVAEIGGDERDVGRILGIAMIAALGSGVFSGHLADWLGRVQAIALAGLAQLAALLLIATMAEPVYMGLVIGIGLGFGWAVFYLLTPIFTVGISPSDQRVKFLTIVSGLMMLGMGLGPTLSRLLLAVEVSVSGVFYCGAALSALSAVLFIKLIRLERTLGSNLQGSASLKLGEVRAIFSTKAAIPIIMIAVGGAIFGCLTNYQTAIAEAKEIDFSLFFAVFVLTVVIARLGLAGKINAQPPLPTTVGLQVLMCAALISYAYLPQSSLVFVLTTIVFGVGYGLTYSVLNGIVANIKETKLLQPALLVFPLAYFGGLYGFPFIGGWLIVTGGVSVLLLVLMILGLFELGCAVYALLRQRRSLQA